MTNKCDGTSAGVIVKRDSKILLIERKKYNPGFALPAGHQDGLASKDAAAKELFEETGLIADKLELRLGITLENPCKREACKRHYWSVFEALEWRGVLNPSKEEVKRILWADEAKIKELAQKLENFMIANRLTINKLPALVAATNKSSIWTNDPGLEPPMYVLFKALKII